MPVNPDVQMEAETLAYWAHISPPADSADLMVFFAGQLHEAKAEQAEKRGRGDRDPALAQRIVDLTELTGVLADARRRRVPLDPYVTNPLVIAGAARRW